MNKSPLTPSAIFLQATDALDHLIEIAKKPKGFKDPSLATQFRAELFHLEGWARLHRRWENEQDRERLEKIRKDTKVLEDALGRVDLLLSLSAEAKKKKSEILEKVFADDLETAYRGLKRVLKQNGWFDQPKSRTAKFRRRLSKIAWPTDEAHYQYLAQEIVSSVSKLQQRFDLEIRPELSKPLTHEILEHDIHEFRRELRWFAIYFQTGQGLFALSPMPKKLTTEDKKLVATYKNSPFTKLPKSSMTKGWLDPLAYIELTRLIQITGEIKDKAEKFFFIKEGLMKAGVSEPLAHQQATDWYGDVTISTVEKMQKVVAEYDRKRPLNQLSQDVAKSL